VFNNAEFHNGGSILFATFVFTIQIYADFSGYSDMAIGTAKMLGINLKVNFRTPYFASSVTEFWSRWHITLSLWLRDYVFIPLGGSQRSKWLNLRNLFITFFLAGVWHGASWNFVLWGCLHAIIVIIEKLVRLDRPGSTKIGNGIRVCITFFIIMLTMLPVRADDLDHLTLLVDRIIHMQISDLYLPFAENKFTPGVLGIVVLFLTDFFVARNSILSLNDSHWFLRYSWLTVIIFLIILLGDHTGEAFFYFQF